MKTLQPISSTKQLAVIFTFITALLISSSSSVHAQNWETMQNAEYGISLDMPTSFKQSVSENQNTKTLFVESYYDDYSVFLSAQNYKVDISGVAPVELAARVIKSTIDSGGWSLEESSETTNSGVPGVKALLHDPVNKKYQHIMVFVDGQMVYNISVFREQQKPEEAFLATFTESLSINN